MTRGIIRNITAVVMFSCCCRFSSAAAAGPILRGRGSPVPKQAVCPPGAPPGSGCPEGGPDSHEFWVKDRRAEAPSGKEAFYRVTADRIAVTGHFVLYREAGQETLMTAAQAEEVLSRLEPAFAELKHTYGGGTCPDAQDTGRTVLLAYDIRDDYTAMNPSYISGFFAPRDLFDDAFTLALYDNPDYINEFGNLGELESAANLTGRSNEVQIVYLDLHPFFDGAALGGDTVKAKNLFCEAALHELSHLFTYNRRVLDGSVRNHTAWISEGLAEQAPRALAGLDAGQAESLEQYSLPLVQELIAAAPSLLDLNSSGNPLAGYVMTNLFFNYLRHRAGSEAAALLLLEALVTGDDESVYGLSQVLEDIPSGTAATTFPIFSGTG